MIGPVLRTSLYRPLTAMDEELEEKKPVGTRNAHKGVAMVLSPGAGCLVAKKQTIVVHAAGIENNYKGFNASIGYSIMPKFYADGGQHTLKHYVTGHLGYSFLVSKDTTGINVYLAPGVRGGYLMGKRGGRYTGPVKSTELKANPYTFSVPISLDIVKGESMSRVSSGRQEAGISICAEPGMSVNKAFSKYDLFLMLGTRLKISFEFGY